jgi:hypothetical protein
MKYNPSSARQVMGLFGFVWLCAGFLLVWPLTNFIFGSPKGIAFIDYLWAVPIFALTCGLAGGVIPYGIMRSASLDWEGCKFIFFVTLLEILIFVLISIIGEVICRRIHAATLDVPRWIANTIFLMIPITTMLVVLSVGVYKRHNNIK